jgi:hypothetical protein
LGRERLIAVRGFFMGAFVFLPALKKEGTLTLIHAAALCPCADTTTR